MKKWLFIILNIILINVSYAQQELTILQRNAEQNELKILDNRFRIDYQVDEITLVFFRDQGTPSVILVRPDGTKINLINSFTDDTIEWGDGYNYDIIKIKRPMPGPWQAIGDILPQSKLMVLSDIELHVEPLPPMLFKGEVLKLTAHLTNSGRLIEENLFRDVVALKVDFISTNNQQYLNFGAKPVSVSELFDNGQGYDEIPADGVFTGEYEFDFAAGEWQPEYQVSTPILTRRAIKSPLILEPFPLTFNFEQASEGQEEHTLVFNPDPNKLILESLIYKGTVNYPNGERDTFDLRHADMTSPSLLLTNYDWGIYELEMAVFGTNINGREFVANLESQEFEIERVVVSIPSNQPPVTKETLPTTLVTQPEPNNPQTELLSRKVLIWAVVGNLLMVILGLIVIRVYVQKKPIFSERLTRFINMRKTQKEQKAESSEYKSDSLDEILNLSLPDE